MKKMQLAMLFGVMICVSCNSKKTGKDENPLLQDFNTPFNVPPFEKIKPAHFMPAFEEAMKIHDQEIDNIVNNPEKPTFLNTIDAFFTSGELLYRVRSVFDNLINANTNPELQKISEQVNPMLSAHGDAIIMNLKLFKRIKDVYDNRFSFKLTPEQLYLLERLYKSFVCNGALLSADKQEELKKINQELSSLTTKFDKNLLAETNAFKLVVDKKESLAGLPDAVIQDAASTAKQNGQEGKWIFTTQKPSMIPFLQYAQNRELREKLYKAYINRGNNNNSNDNKNVLSRIVILREQKAKLLGYPTYAAYRLEDRMAKTPDKVFDLLNRLWEKSQKVSKQEAAQLQNIIDKDGGNFKLESWDWWYYAEKLRNEKYNLDENELRPYFKLENVRDGVFAVFNKMYGVTFTPIKNIPLPHPEAQAYEVKESDGKHLGVFYLDFFPRESKNGGAWCDGYNGHHFINGKEITPVITVVCNFTKPTKDLPSLLSMDEVETLFHECGHAIEGLTSKSLYTSSYVARDFVELPSQLMEHWAFNPEVLKLYAKHYKTGEIMPDELIEKINNSSLFNQGFNTTEYIAASLLDMAYHTITGKEKIDVTEFENDYFKKIGLIPEIISRYRGTYFSHIVGGYDAGYYGYIWASVLDNDAFESFKENGIFDKKTAESFRKNILEEDGMSDPEKMYINFKGREASIEPLLKNKGLM